MSIFSKLLTCLVGRGTLEPSLILKNPKVKRLRCKLRLLLDLGALVDFIALDVEPPSNFNEIVDVLKGTLVPVLTINYKSFQVKNVKAYGETKTVVSLLPLLLGENDHFASDYDRAFTNIIPLVEE